MKKKGDGEEEKRTNEIGVAQAVIDEVPDIEGCVITGDAMFTQRSLAEYITGRDAHYLFIVKGNQETLHDEIKVLFNKEIPRRKPDFVDAPCKPKHGRQETRLIWASDKLNEYSKFPGLQQVFAIVGETVQVCTGHRSEPVIFYGVTSLPAEEASAERLLTLKRNHWAVETLHNILDTTLDEDRSRIRTDYGPENMTALRRFAISVIHQRGLPVAETMRDLHRSPRRLLDFLKMTANSRRALAA